MIFRSYSSNLQDNRLEAAIYFFIAAISLFSFGFSNFAADLGCVLAVFYLSVLLYFVFKLDQAFFWLVTPVMILKFTELFGLFFINSGSYLDETDTVGFPTGAAYLLPFYYLSFVFFAYVGFVLQKRRRSNCGAILSIKANPSYLVTVSLVMIILGVYASIDGGFALLKGVNRYEVRASYSSFYLRQFLNNASFIMFALGAAMTGGRRIKIFSAIAAAIILLIAILHGEQFNATLSLLLHALMGYSLLKVSKGFGTGRETFLIGAIILLATGVVVLVYYLVGYDLYEKVGSRLALQAQMWFQTYINGPNFFQFDFAHFLRNFNSLFRGDNSHFVDTMPPIGMREFMLYTAIPWVYDEYLLYGVTFTMGQFATPVYFWGYIGAFLLIVPSAIFFGFAGGLLYESLASMCIVKIFICSKIFIWCLFGLAQGEYWYLFNIKILIVTFVYLFFVRSLNRNAKDSVAAA